MTDPIQARRRFVLLYAVPTFLVLLAVCAPLIRGLETFYLRDVLNAHLQMKWAQARALQDGYFPLIDPYRAGGQPIAGNPNAAPFYPTTLLFLAGSPFWALNVQFWLHWLLAPLAFFWMAREWGLSREGAWAGGVCFALSGFFVSHLSFYNLIAGVTLAPALIAGCLRLARGGPGGRRPWMAVAVAGLWALLAVSGDPLMALLAFGLAAAAAVVSPHPPAPSPASPPPSPGEGEKAPNPTDPTDPSDPSDVTPTSRRRWWLGWRPLALLAGCFTAGTLLALPQLVEFLRILPLSFRGQKGYTPEVATLASWDPYQIAEWFLPMVFGRLDLLSLGSFWGKKFYTGIPPYYVTLYPGLLALALVLASGRPRSSRRVAAWWAWGAVVFGLFFSLGKFNPAAEWVFTLRNGALRYPVKFWLPVAVGAALLCGLGFQRLLGPEEDPITRRARRRFRLALLGLFLVLGALWVFLTFQPGPAEELAARIIPKAFQNGPLPFVRNERLRWAGLCLFSFAVLAGLAVGARLLRRRPMVGGAVLLAVHAIAQVLLLRPAFPTDPIQPYLIPPPALAYVPADVRVVNPDLNSLFGRHTLREGQFPERTGNWLERRAFYELYSFTGPQWRRRYDLNVSPEGLDTYLARMAQGAVKASNDEQRIRMLAAWGVGRLVQNHPLTPETPGVRQLAAIPSFGHHLYIYEVLNRAPEVFLARQAVFAPQMNAAYKTLSGAQGGVGVRFDPRSDVVLPGEGKPETLGGGTVRVVKDEPEELEVDVDAGAGGSVLVVQRSALLQKATVDGRPAEVLAANLQRMGVRVPAGRHRVRLWVDRRPFELSLGGTALGLLLLPALFWWGRRSPLG